MGSGTFGHIVFLFVQFSTMLILWTGANTPFSGFPFLANFIAEDGFLPHQLSKRGHRLVFSNGIFFLTITSAVLLIVIGPHVDKLILLRHGESQWNALNLFTGWVDVDLSEKGAAEAARGGELLKAAGILPDVLHTSLLRRAIKTAQLALDTCDRHWIPVRRSWRLNERHYGALQGLDKKETTERHGAEQTRLWRRSFDVPPPPVDAASPEHPANDPRYRLLPPDVLPMVPAELDVISAYFVVERR